jgi:hypothetical protein
LKQVEDRLQHRQARDAQLLASNFEAVGQFLIDQRKQDDPRRRFYFANSLINLCPAAHEGIDMLDRRHPFILRRSSPARRDQGFPRRIRDKMQMKVVTLQKPSPLAAVLPKVPGKPRGKVGIAGLARRPRPFIFGLRLAFFHRNQPLQKSTVAAVNRGEN